MVEEMLAERRIVVGHKTIRRWALMFGATFAAKIRRPQTPVGNKWRLDKVMIAIDGEKHWPWRAVDQHGVVLDVLVRRRRNARTAPHTPRRG